MLGIFRRCIIYQKSAKCVHLMVIMVFNYPIYLCFLGDVGLGTKSCCSSVRIFVFFVCFWIGKFNMQLVVLDTIHLALTREEGAICDRASWLALYQNFVIFYLFIFGLFVCFFFGFVVIL